MLLQYIFKLKKEQMLVRIYVKEANRKQTIFIFNKNY